MQKESRYFKYCPYCSTGLVAKELDGNSRMVCPECGFIHYLNPAPAVGVLIVKDSKVLLVQRRYEPFRGKWVIPSGFVEWDEDVSQTARRELKEETGYDVGIESLYDVKSCFDDPRGNTILILYKGTIVGGEMKAGDDASDIGFFELNSLPEIAFEAHRDVLERLRREVSA